VKKKIKLIILWCSLIVVLAVLGIMALLIYPAINFENLKTRLESSQPEERNAIIMELKNVNPKYLGELQSLFQRHDADLSWNLSDLYYSAGLVDLRIEKTGTDEPKAEIVQGENLAALNNFAKFYVGLYFLDEKKDTEGVEALVPLIAGLPFAQVEHELLRRLVENSGMRSSGSKIVERIALALTERDELSDITYAAFKKLMESPDCDWQVRFIIADHYASLPESDKRRGDAVQPLIKLAEEAWAEKNYNPIIAIVKKLVSTKRNDVPPLLEKLLNPETINDLPDAAIEEAARGLSDFGRQRDGELMIKALCATTSQSVAKALIDSALAILGRSSFDEIRESIMKCENLVQRFKALAYLGTKGDKASLNALASTVSRTSLTTEERVLAADALAYSAGKDELKKLERIRAVEMNADLKKRLGAVIEIIKRRLN
jgi:hypothetical protein